MVSDTRPTLIPPSNPRPTGFYWVAGLGIEPEPARWDAQMQVWHTIGGYEGLPDEGVTVMGERLVPPVGRVVG